MGLGLLAVVDRIQPRGLALEVGVVAFDGTC